MVDNQKSLTVEYGTFTCTLTGYDDPFPILRQTVEFLQGVSDSDPEFGTGGPLDHLTGEGEPPAEQTGSGADMAAAPEVEAEEDAPLTLTSADTVAPDGPDADAEEPLADIDLSAMVEETNAIVDADAGLSTEVTAPADEVLVTVADPVVAEAFIEEGLAEAPAPAPTPDPSPAAATSAPLESEAEETAAAPVADPGMDLGLKSALADALRETDDAEAAAQSAARPAADPDSARVQKGVHLNFGHSPGLNQSRDIPVTDPAGATAERARVSLPDDVFEDDGGPADFEFPPVADPAPTEQTLRPETPAAEPQEPDPLVLTTDMSVEKPDSDIAPVTASVSLPDAPVLRLVEAVDASDPAETDLDAITQAVRAFVAKSGAQSLPDALEACAQSLPDALEACAAWLALDQNQPSFTRTEILRLLDQTNAEGAISQEARIKAFGALLRGGRIQRVESGRFELSRNAREIYSRAMASNG